MKKGLISIIVPVYKAEEYLDRCVESLVNQTYTNLEIILVDDGSPDNSGKLCDEWALKDKRIKVIHKENGGVSSARKIGVENSNGDYISFVDSDDYIDSFYFEKLILSSENGMVDIVCCNFVEINGNNFSNDKKIDEYFILKDRYMFYKYLLDGYSIFYILVGKIISKRIINYIEFPNIKYSEDTFGMISLIENANCIVGLNYDGYYYVRNNSSVSFNVNNITQKKLDEIETYLYLLNNVKNINNILYEKVLNDYIHYIFCAIKFNIYFSKLDNFDYKIKEKIKVIPNSFKKNNKEYFIVKKYYHFSFFIKIFLIINKNIKKIFGGSI